MIGREAILSWFRTYFSDALLLLGEDKLLEDFTRNPRSPLISIKVRLTGTCSMVENLTDPIPIRQRRIITRIDVFYWATLPIPWCPFMDRDSTAV